MKKLLIAATGSVAIVKLQKTIELLKKEFQVKLIVSNYVLKNFQGIEKLKPIIEDTSLDSFPEHIKLAKWADQIIVIPASTNTIAKFNAGVADNPLLSTLIAARQRIIFVPAMNTYMYQALEQRNLISNLSSLGHIFIGPTHGKLREGEIGLGRMVEPEDIFNIVKNYFFSSKKKVLITYGASKVYLDPIRFITNNSSGMMGKVLANELRLQGFNVSAIDVSKYTNKELLNHIKKINFDIYIGTAALADFYIDKNLTKIKKSSTLILDLKQNIDLIIELKKLYPKKTYIAFKHDNSKDAALSKMQQNSFDYIVWNKIGSMGQDNISGAILGSKKEFPFNNISKLKLAKLIGGLL